MVLLCETLVGENWYLARTGRIPVEVQYRVFMLCAFDRSVPSNDPASLSMDLFLAQPLIDHSAPSLDGF